MLELRSIRVFDLSDAPLEVRESDEFAPVDLVPGATDAVLMLVIVGQYETETETEGFSPDRVTREITYSEYCLHRWLMQRGAEAGEPVLLRWS